MAESIQERMQFLPDVEASNEIRTLLQAQREATDAMAAKLDALGAKLNADAGVTDTDYAEDNATTVSGFITQ